MSKPTKIHMPHLAPHWCGLGPPACDLRYIRVKSSAVVHRDTWRWLPREIQCETCRKLCCAGPDECAPDWLVISMECLVAELAKLGDAMRAGEHRCWVKLGDPCPCGLHSVLDVRNEALWLTAGCMGVLRHQLGWKTLGMIGWKTLGMIWDARIHGERYEMTWTDEPTDLPATVLPVTMEWSE